MPVKILSRVTDSPFNDVGEDNNFLIGNIGDWLRTTIEFEAGFYYETSQTNPATVTQNGEIERNSGSWIDDGFEIGDSIDVEVTYFTTGTGVVTATYTRTIDDLTDTTLTLDTSTGVNFSVIYPSQAVGGDPNLIALSLVVKTDKTPEEIELQYNQFPNSEISSSPQESIIDGNKNVFIRQNVDGTLTTMTEIGNKSGGAITTAQCRFLSKTDVWYKYEIVINHSIWGYFESLGNFEPLLDAPDFFNGAECLTDNFKLFVRKNNNDPNVQLTTSLNTPITQKEGNTGYFDENFNGKPNNYEITTFSWEDTSGNSIDGLAYNQDSVLKITVNDDNSGFTTTGSLFSFFICYIPQVDTDWKNKKYPFQDLTVMNNLGIDFTFTPQVHSASPIVSVLSGFTHPDGARLDVIERHFEVTAANTLEVTLKFSPNAALQTFMEDKDPFNRKWLFGLSVGSDTANVADSDRVRLHGLSDAIEAVTPVGEYDDLTLQFTNWDGESTASPLVSSVDMQPKDDVQVVGELLLDRSASAPDLEKIESRIDLYETSTGSYTELDSVEIDTTGAVVTPNGIQQINLTGQRGFNYPSTFKREQCSIIRNPSLDAGTDAGYDISFPFRVRYEDWIARTGLPSAMYDNSKPNDGLNNFWRWLASGGGVGSGFELRHSILLYFDNGDVYRNPTSLNDFDYYDQKEDTHRIRHYNETKTTNLFINAESYTSVAGTPYVVNNNAILNNNKTRISALFKSVNICQNVDYAEISIEVREGAGFKSVWKMRTDLNPSSNNPLEPISGNTNLLITYPNANEIEVECLLDYSKLPQVGEFELSAQIKTADTCGCTSIDIIVTGSDFAGTYTTTKQPDGTFEDATGDWIIYFNVSFGTWFISYQGTDYASWKNTAECPEHSSWTLTPEAGSNGITEIRTEEPDCECVQYIERILGYGTALQLPQDDPEEREKIQCCPAIPVLATTATNDPYKNDWAGFMYKREDSNFTVDYFLIDCSTGDEIALNDDTYGTFYNFGDLPNGNDYIGYYLDWQAVINLLGAGIYVVVWDVTAFGSTARKSSCKYDLQVWTEDRANKTVRVETIMDGIIEETGMDYRGTQWKDSLRFYGTFGKQQPTYEVESVVQGDNNVKPIRSQLVGEYSLEGHLNNSCITDKLINYHLRGNRIFISDYNRFNHKVYKGFAVRLKSSEGFEYPSKTRDAKFTILFEDDKLNRIKSNCGVNDLFQASGAPTFENLSCEPATYDVEYADGTPIESGSIDSGGFKLITVPDCPQDLFLYFDYESGDTTITGITIDANSAGTITSVNSTGLTNFVIEVNGSPVTTPFTLNNTDTVEMTFDAAGSDGEVIFTGTY